MSKHFIQFFTHSPCLNCGQKHRNINFYHLCQSCTLPTILDDTTRCPNCKRATKCISCEYDSWESVTAIFPYQNNIAKTLIHLYKFHNSVLAERDLCTLLKPYLESYKDKIIIPIPCSIKTKRDLGFNPVERILDIMNIPYHNLLIKSSTKHRQKDLTGENRKKQANFIKLSTSIPDHIKNKKIFLVDDVMTSGTTMHHAITTLKENGCTNIHVLSLFRD